MKLPFILLLLLSLPQLINAQGDPPSWLDPYSRQSRFPANQYLTGLSSEIVKKGQSISDIYGQLNQMTRNQIIESIRVDVKAVTELNISAVNTESTQLFNQNSVSEAEADLVGLKVENYYNKKKKLAFSFSYVLIQDLIKYNLDIIQLNTIEIDKNNAAAKAKLEAGQKEAVVDLLFESQNKLKEINKSAVVLMSLDQEDQLSFDKIREMKSAVQEITNDLFTKGRLNTDIVAAYIASQLQLQLAEEPVVACTGKISYEGSENESNFSTALKNRSLNKLSDYGILKIGDSDCQLTYEGSYGESDGIILVTANLIGASGALQAGVTTKFASDIFDNGDLTFLPTNFEYIPKLSSISLTSNEKDYNIKKVDLFDYPINIEVRDNGEPIPDVPLDVSITRNDKVEFETTISTDKSGNVSFLLNTEQLKKSGSFVATTTINAAAFLDIPRSSDFYKNIILEHPPQILQNKIQLLAPTVFVSSSELSLGQERAIPILSASVKEALAELDYEFVNSIEEADYSIEIVAATRKGQSYQNAYFSYLDATVSMKQTDNGNEIYKYSVSNVKGGAGDFNGADAKAYDKAKKLIADDLSYKLEFGK